MNKIFILSLMVLMTMTSCEKKTTNPLDEFLSSAADQNLFSGSVLIMEKGEKVFEGSYGYRNKEKGEKNTNDTKYRAYSITKAFTATVILQLIEEGKLALTDTLSSFFPEYTLGENITIENLLGHTSGIPDVVDTDKTKDSKTLMEFLSTMPLHFEPNSQWRYSNSNYYILGNIIKEVTGKDYDVAIEERILKPLGMTNSGFHFNELQDPKKAIGYSFLSDKNYTPAMLYKTDQPFGAGAIYSTVGDLYKFSEAIKKNTLLNPETIELASVPQKGSTYGLGFDLGTLLDSPKIGHSGGGPGFISVMFRAIEEDITIIFSANSENIPYAITERIYAYALKKPNTFPFKQAIKNKSKKDLEGIYSDGQTEFHVQVNDEVLLYNEKNTFKCALLPVSDSLFLFGDSFFSLAFSNDTMAIQMADGTVRKAHKTDQPFVWGIIGDATPNGWGGEDLIMQTLPDQPQVFILKDFKMKKGGFQFRQNNDWNNAIALSANGELVPNGYNIEVEDGIYDITLDMTNRMKPKYTLVKVE